MWTGKSHSLWLYYLHTVDNQAHCYKLSRNSQCGIEGGVCSVHWVAMMPGGEKIVRGTVKHLL